MYKYVQGHNHTNMQMQNTFRIFDQQTAVSVINGISAGCSQTFGGPFRKAKKKKKNIENKITPKCPKKNGQIHLETKNLFSSTAV